MKPLLILAIIFLVTFEAMGQRGANPKEKSGGDIEFTFDEIYSSGTEFKDDNYVTVFEIDAQKDKSTGTRKATLFFDLELDSGDYFGEENAVYLWADNSGQKNLGKSNSLYTRSFAEGRDELDLKEKNIKIVLFQFSRSLTDKYYVAVYDKTEHNIRMKNVVLRYE